MLINRRLTVLALAALLSGCINSGRYDMKNDQAPLRKPTSLETNDAKPVYEAIYPWSLKPYTINGKHYVPLKTAEGFQESGVASWYGRKFHGYDTANGEVYDMFAMTAAHKTLPIPSFVRVTNLDNKKSIIVRVNDRGPFHNNRIIDLSYSAAYMLNVLDTGTANVSLQAIVVPEGGVYPPAPVEEVVEKTKQISAEPPAQTAIKPPAATDTAPKPVLEKQLFVQVLAASDGSKIANTAEKLSTQYQLPNQIPKQNGIFKLRLGPLVDKKQAQSLISALKNNGYPNAYMLYTTPALTHN